MGWQLIESQSLQSSAASVTFSNIPQTYKSLKLLVTVRGTSGGFTTESFSIRPNAATTNLSQRVVYGNGASAVSETESTVRTYGVGTNTTSNTFSSAEITFPNYSGSTNKPISIEDVTENNATTAISILHASLWSSTSAITSIELAAGISQFAFGSTFTLYGLL